MNEIGLNRCWVEDPARFRYESIGPFPSGGPIIAVGFGNISCLSLCELN